LTTSEFLAALDPERHHFAEDLHLPQPPLDVLDIRERSIRYPDAIREELSGTCLFMNKYFTRSTDGASRPPVSLLIPDEPGYE
jgi:hypothetical protein